MMSVGLMVERSSSNKSSYSFLVSVGKSDSDWTKASERSLRRLKVETDPVAEPAADATGGVTGAGAAFAIATPWGGADSAAPPACDTAGGFAAGDVTPGGLG
jgi:hypothetical protein